MVKQYCIHLGKKQLRSFITIMNEMTTEEKKLYNELLMNVSKHLDGNSVAYYIDKVRLFVEVVNLRIEGANYKNEYDY